MKKFLVYFIFLVCCFFIYETKDVYAAELSNYYKSFKMDYSSCTLPNCSYTADFITSLASFSSGGSYSYDITFANNISNADELSFTVAFYNPLKEFETNESSNNNNFVTGWKTESGSYENLTIVARGLNYNHGQCFGYYAGNNSITYHCHLNPNEIYTGLSIKYNLSLSTSGSQAFNLSINKFGSLYIKDHSTNSDVIDNQNENQQQTNDKLDNLDESINKGNQETQGVIKDQFNSCRESINLLDINKFAPKTTNGMSAVINDDKTLTFNGTTTSLSNFWFSNLNLKLEAGTYYFNSNVNLNGKGLYRFVDENNNTVYSSSNPGSFTVTDTVIVTGLIQINSGVSFNNTVFKLQIANKNSSWEPYGEEICSNKIDDTNKELGNLNDNLTDDSIDNSSANSFFDNYKDNDYGLSSVITAPLQFIQNLNSNVCNELSVPLPYVNKNLKLPCMSSIYSNYFGSFFTMYQAITTGFIAYWVAVRIFALVKGFKDPEDDKIEVMDL